MEDQTNNTQSSNDSAVPSHDDTASAEISPATESIRREALEALMPLVDKMDVPAERKFEIVMTAVRVNYNEELLRKALESAKAIEDPTAKAEALIDVLNETSYQEAGV